MNGKGFVERSGFDRTDSIEHFFAAVGKETRSSVRRMLPLDLDRRTAATIISGVERSGYVHDLDLDRLSSALIAPIRTIVDRGGRPGVRTSRWPAATWSAVTHSHTSAGWLCLS